MLPIKKLSKGYLSIKGLFQTYDGGFCQKLKCVLAWVLLRTKVFETISGKNWKVTSISIRIGIQNLRTNIRIIHSNIRKKPIIADSTGMLK